MLQSPLVRYSVSFRIHFPFWLSYTVLSPLVYFALVSLVYSSLLSYILPFSYILYFYFCCRILVYFTLVNSYRFSLVYSILFLSCVLFLLSCIPLVYFFLSALVYSNIFPRVSILFLLVCSSFVSLVYFVFAGICFHSRIAGFSCIICFSRMFYSFSRVFLSYTHSFLRPYTCTSNRIPLVSLLFLLVCSSFVSLVYSVFAGICFHSRKYCLLILVLYVSLVYSTLALVDSSRILLPFCARILVYYCSRISTLPSRIYSSFASLVCCILALMCSHKCVPRI